MAKPLWVVAGVVLVLLGLLWTLQGIGVIEGSSMSGTTTWSIIGPIVLLVGGVVMSVGIRGRRALTGRRSGAGSCSGLLGLGALGVVTGSAVQDGLSRLLAPGPAARPDRAHLAGAARQHLALLLRDRGGRSRATPRRTPSKVSGLVDRPATYSLADLRRCRRLSFTDDFQCVTGWHVPDVPWTGVRVADLLDRRRADAARPWACGSARSTAPTRST